MNTGVKDVMKKAKNSMIINRHRVFCFFHNVFYSLT